MNTDELIAKLLDGTISDTERAHLEEYLSDTPEAAHDVRELLALEGLLTAPGVDEPAQSAVFRHSVEDHIAATVSNKPGASALPSSGGMNVWKWMLIAGASIAVGVASYVLFVSHNEQPPATLSHVSAPVQKEVVPSHENARPRETITSSPEQKQDGAVRSERPIEKTIIQQEKKSVEREKEHDNDQFRGAINNPSGNPSEQKLIQGYKDKLAGQLAQGDKVGAALSAKMIGSLSRQTGNYQESDRYLQQALALARTTKAQELEAEVLGEIGLLEEAQQHYDAAQHYLHDCINALRRYNSAKIDRWEQELQKIEGVQK